MDAVAVVDTGRMAADGEVGRRFAPAAAAPEYSRERAADRIRDLRTLRRSAAPGSPVSREVQ